MSVLHVHGFVSENTEKQSICARTELRILQFNDIKG